MTTINDGHGGDQSYDLAFRNLCVDIHGTPILKDVSGVAEQGQLLALMGPSGSGKSTLLNALFSRYSVTSGDVMVGSRPISKELRRKMSYVLQENTHLAQLPLKDTLYFAGMLRLPDKMSRAEKLQRIDEIVNLLELGKCLNTAVGGPMYPGLSGGERKRATIACEILGNPEIILLDEPTTGLDYAIAYQLLKILQTYAREANKTIITSIHQPSSEMFYMFDKLLLLCEGQTAYYGEQDDVLPYFEQLGLICEPEYNPSDFLLDVVSGANPSRHEITEAAKGRFLMPLPDAERRAAKAERTDGEETSGKDGQLRDISKFSSDDARWQSGFWTQYKLLCHRSVLWNYKYIFNKYNIYIHVLFAVVTGLIYWQLPRTEETLTDRAGLMSLFCIFCGVSVQHDVCLGYSQISGVIMQERAAGLYRLSAFYLAKVTSEAPLAIVLPASVLLIGYWMAGLTASAANFFAMLAALLLMVLTSQSIGAAIGVSGTTPSNTFLLFNIVFHVMLMSGGYYQSNLPFWIDWFKYLSCLYHGFSAISHVEFTSGDPFRCSANHSSFADCRETNVTQFGGALYLERIGILHPIWFNILFLIAMFVACHSLAYVILRFIRRPKTLN